MINELTWQLILNKLVNREDLSLSQAEWAMSNIMTHRVSPAQLSAFLVSLRMKGETVDEVVGFRDAILTHCTPINLPSDCLDIVGTGGDSFSSVNVSSMAAVVAAAAGIPVIKHGNTASTSRSGSADVFKELGVNIEATIEEIIFSFESSQIAFINAKRFHRGFASAASVRKEIGIPTVFNFLGPLCNPTRPEASAVGVAQLDRVPLIVGVFQTRGANALVFRGDEGIDELSISGHSHIWEVSRGLVKEHDLDPRDLDIPRSPIETIRGQDPAYNASAARAVFAGKQGPIRDIVVLNAAAGLIAYDLHRNPSSTSIPLIERFRNKLLLAEQAIDSGSAAEKLASWTSYNQ